MNTTGGMRNFFGNNIAAGGGLPPTEEHSITFHAPELPAETLLDREHNETLAKLNFVLALTDCILEVADSKCAPLSALMSADSIPVAPHAPENCKRTERLVLLVRYENISLKFQLTHFNHSIYFQNSATSIVWIDFGLRNPIERLPATFNVR